MYRISALFGKSYLIINKINIKLEINVNFVC